MSRKGVILSIAALAALALWSGEARAQGGDGTGVDSQLLWPAPGPSPFPTVLSSDIVGHKGVAFSAVFQYYRKPLGLDIEDASGEVDTEWVVDYAFTADFLWGFGIADIFQIGLALPVVLDQGGVGATPFLPAGTSEATYELAGSALRDIRLSGKVRFLGGNAEDPERRGLGLALDVGASLPTGDELNFAGDEGFVFVPTAVLDYHHCWLTVALDVGARLRTAESSLADLTVGHQGTAGIGVTATFLDRTLLASLEAVGYAEFDGFDRLGLEYRAGIGYSPDEAKSVTVWASGGSSVGTGDLLGTPEARVLLGVTYAPPPGEEPLDFEDDLFADDAIDEPAPSEEAPGGAAGEDAAAEVEPAEGEIGEGEDVVSEEGAGEDDDVRAEGDDVYTEENDIYADDGDDEHAGEDRDDEVAE